MKLTLAANLPDDLAALFLHTNFESQWQQSPAFARDASLSPGFTKQL
jgi:kynurenine formamidase